MQFDQRERTAGADDFADFWAPDPRPRVWDGLSERALPAGRRLRRGAVRCAAVAVAVAACSTLTAVPAAAENLDSLLGKADELSDEYNGELRDMEGVLEDAKKADERAKKTQKEVDDAREHVRRLAVSQYTGGGLEPALTLFVEDEPQDLIDRSLLVHHLSENNEDRIEGLQQAISRDKKARDNAQGKVDIAEKDLKKLDDRRAKVQKMIADHPAQEMGPPDNLTPRTRQMKEVISEKFGENKKHGGVGCYRPDGGFVVGEHPKGRACDFMVDNNGQMPSQEQIDHGQEIADWGKKNADRLGIMYIIYRQQIWDVRRGGGWRDMSDRGSITENHFDHVHISMF
ncbi:hypothetical protein CLV63_11141 [Murinocardiopsis flavida]|uniref:ARB-07466-like C-terminal domain-containing protein n=1 Tax=Murinocardiopsis flavida TaxID=645275 RepID=A0A2P8DGV3_9ACTN|nr:hypothetical protein [Murinocardiopsis flavida]PSK96447.1 hypothetical protein CLV63_11141 [Murinocardiopsis flavida]